MKITLYKKAGCPWSAAIIGFLDELNIPYEIKNVTSNESSGRRCEQRWDYRHSKKIRLCVQKTEHLSPILGSAATGNPSTGPLVWRRLLVVSETSLGELHEMLQSAFGWSGEHLHRFLIHGVAYGIPHVGGIVFREDARGVPLSRFRLHCGERFRYEYDFTADWKLDIRLEGALPFDSKRALPSCIDGRRAGPPEDCAGASDYLRRLDWQPSHRRDAYHGRSRAADS